MRPVVPRDELAQLVAQLAGGLQCVWADDANAKQGASRKAAWIELTVTNLVTSGWDEYRVSENPVNPDAYVVNVSGYAQFTVQMRAKSYDVKLQPYDILEQVRWRLGGFTAAAFYEATNVALVDNSAIVPMRGTTGGPGTRVRLDANMDVTFSTVTGGPATDDPGQTIGQVNGGDGVPFTPS